MSEMRRQLLRSGRRIRAAGFTLLEVLVAAVILVLVFFGLAQVYARGRGQVDFEEDRRRATGIVQARLDGIRRDYRYDTLPNLHDVDTTYVVDGRSYVVSHDIAAGFPEGQATTIALTVTWNAKVAGSNVPRSLGATTVLGRGMP